MLTLSNLKDDSYKVYPAITLGLVSSMSVVSKH